MLDPRGYARIVGFHRARQLALVEESIRRIEAVYRYAALNAGAVVKRYDKAGHLDKRHLNRLLDELRLIFGRAHDDFYSVLLIGMLGAAQVSCDEHSEIAKGLLFGSALDEALHGLSAGMAKTASIGGVGNVGVCFSDVAKLAVLEEHNRSYDDDLSLPDRLEKMGGLNWQEILGGVAEDIVEDAALDLCLDLFDRLLASKGNGNIVWNATRLGVTEIGAANREGILRSAFDERGKLKRYVKGFCWRLSPRHRVPDICDVWASQDKYGLGPGVYPPGMVPMEHPLGMCHVIPLLDNCGLPSVIKEPMPGVLPDSVYMANGLDLPEYRKKLEELELGIRDLRDCERAYVIDEDGRILLTRDGSLRRTEFSDAEASSMENCYLTHNHPNETSFSPADISFACTNNLAQVRVVTPYWRYTVTRPSGGWTKSYWYDKIEPSFIRNKIAVDAEFGQAVTDGKMPHQMARILESQEIWKRTFGELNIPYRRELWKGRWAP